MKPVVTEGASSVDVYLPGGVIWYDVDTMAPVRGEGAHRSVDAPLDKIPVYQRGGSIIPRCVGGEGDIYDIIIFFCFWRNSFGFFTSFRWVFGRSCLERHVLKIWGIRQKIAFDEPQTHDARNASLPVPALCPFYKRIAPMYRGARSLLSIAESNAFAGVPVSWSQTLTL